MGRVRASGRRRVAVVVIVVMAAAAGWAPALVAHHYADGPGGAEVNRGRIDQGWRFIADAVRESRDTQLGHSDAALVHAQRIWARPSGRAEAVDLVWLDGGAFTVPVPDGAVRPGPVRRVARPQSPFGWVVWGHVRGGPRQMIGLLDYRSGRVAWDIRPPLPGGAR